MAKFKSLHHAKSGRDTGFMWNLKGKNNLWIYGMRAVRAIDNKTDCELNMNFFFLHSLKVTRFFVCLLVRFALFSQIVPWDSKQICKDRRQSRWIPESSLSTRDA